MAPIPGKSLIAVLPTPEPHVGFSFSVTSGEGVLFPDPSVDGPFYATIEDSLDPNVLSRKSEVVKVVSRKTDVFTVIRQATGTDARFMRIGDIVSLSTESTASSSSSSCGPWIYIGTPTQVAGQTDVNGNLVSDLVAANPAPFNADPWIPFEGTWNNSLGDDAPVSFMLFGCWIMPRGGAGGGDPDTIVFYFPEGYRPLYQQPIEFAAGDPTLTATCVVGSDGAMTFKDVH